MHGPGRGKGPSMGFKFARRHRRHHVAGTTAPSTPAPGPAGPGAARARPALGARGRCRGSWTGHGGPGRGTGKGAGTGTCRTGMHGPGHRVTGTAARGTGTVARHAGTLRAPVVGWGQGHSMGKQATWGPARGAWGRARARPGGGGGPSCGTAWGGWPAGRGKCTQVCPKPRAGSADSGGGPGLQGRARAPGGWQAWGWGRAAFGGARAMGTGGGAGSLKGGARPLGPAWGGGGMQPPSGWGLPLAVARAGADGGQGQRGGAASVVGGGPAWAYARAALCGCAGCTCPEPALHGTPPFGGVAGCAQATAL